MKTIDAHMKMVEAACGGYLPLGTFPHPDDIDSVANDCGTLIDAVGAFLKCRIAESLDIGVVDIREEVDAFLSDLKSEIRAAYSVASERKREPAR